MEKFKDWAQIKQPEKDHDLVEFLDLIDLDAAIYALCELRLHHPDITEENTGDLSSVIHVTLWEQPNKIRKRSISHPHKFENEIIKRLSEHKKESYKNSIECIKSIKDEDE